MHKLLYYPNFEIQDQDFLKFALLYVDEIRPIIPEKARDSLGNSMKRVMRNTELINPYSPNYENGSLASVAAIKYLHDRLFVKQYAGGLLRNNHISYTYTLYEDKYTYQFENYCLENGLGIRCNEGILLNEDVAYIYMSILAEIISKETETDMITDNIRYSDPDLRYLYNINRRKKDRLDTIQKQIQFYMPVNIHKISLDEFIRLRSDYRFEMARRNFVTELNIVLDAYDKNVTDVNLNNVMECKQEIHSLLKEIFISCAAVVVGVHSFRNMYRADNGTLDFWGNAGNVGISLDTLKQHCYEAREYAARIEGKRQARKYLARLRQL